MQPADRRYGADSDDSPLRDTAGYRPPQPRRAPLQHLPSRPDWCCSSCGQAWPCSPARQELSTEYAHDPTALSTLMWNRLEEYVADHPDGPAGEAFARFVGWAHQV